ncbi:hypothetical protein PR202_gb29156 [Eleusine coracana subsp. coracana]|uniref:WAT1-related protein n=1 Tax=Eleusine coracana subsp. coracana TaxID=191504 RepID=A0AAV5FYQ0_ELECO|nr:hypothetical protein PR202_gb29156 [Eleusine coracana subsp. coracana]
MELAGTWRKVMPFMAMIFLQFGYGGMLLVSVVSLRQGMSHYVLVVYRNGVAAIVMAPFALWFERMERIKIKERRSQAKIAGTAITVCGALLMILVKGPIVMFPWSKHVSHAVSDSSVHNSGHWLLGIIMILLSCFSWSGFFILQGVICSGVAYYVQGIVIKERGPVFVTAFSPLCMIIVTMLGSVILSEVITLGRLIGAIIIVVRLYALIWGKNTDHVNQIDKENNFDKHKQALELPLSCTDTNKSRNHGNI